LKEISEELRVKAEGVYAAHFCEQMGRNDFTANDVKAMRDSHGAYGDRDYMNGFIEGALAALAALEPDAERYRGVRSVALHELTESDRRLTDEEQAKVDEFYRTVPDPKSADDYDACVDGLIKLWETIK
jgi:hypothetical protein